VQKALEQAENNALRRLRPIPRFEDFAAMADSCSRPRIAVEAALIGLPQSTHSPRLDAAMLCAGAASG
jgi:hypothetical protein